MSKNKYSIILPVLNEEENLPLITFFIFDIAKTHKLDIELIIVEDNSKDRTREVAHKLSHFFKGRIVI